MISHEIPLSEMNDVQLKDAMKYTESYQKAILGHITKWKNEVLDTNIETNPARFITVLESTNSLIDENCRKFADRGLIPEEIELLPRNATAEQIISALQSLESQQTLMTTVLKDEIIETAKTKGINLENVAAEIANNAPIKSSTKNAEEQTSLSKIRASHLVGVAEVGIGGTLMYQGINDIKNSNEHTTWKEKIYNGSKALLGAGIAADGAVRMNSGKGWVEYAAEAVGSNLRNR